ncbi:hypothetical protein L1987_25846 [Smallanthus sonchifolius]|uniref:Uncharacterized protein n=1 Tax=Smallanthus sonchifolius TaxID=185202 RepID=A0ACB9I9W0_9ASTR|nr:hypothetical protein L1987_25846 [Smallanthus sonchifolius]
MTSNSHINSSLQLTNNTDKHVGFKVKTTNPKKYCVRPNTGVVLPRSTCEIIVTMQAQKEAPHDMKCKDKFLLQSVIASSEATAKDITPEMFTKDSGNTGSRTFVDSHDKSSEVRSLISKLTDEKNAAVEQSNRIRQELDLLRRGSNKSQGAGVPLMFAIIVGLIGLILGYLMKK